MVPGLRSSRIYVFDTKADRRKPKLVVSFATPEHVDHFARHLGHPYRWLANPARRSYHAFDLGRAGPRDIFTPRSIGYGIKQLMRGHLWRPLQLEQQQQPTEVFAQGLRFVRAIENALALSRLGRTSDSASEPDNIGCQKNASQCK